MSALRIKLARDLRQLRGQVISVALVLACGVGGFVSQFCVHASLTEARDDYYRASRFADIFVSARRAPLALRARLEAIPGVVRVKLENAFDARLALEGLRQPLTVRFIGLELDRTAELNRLTLRSGRLPLAGATLEAVVSERFAEVRGLRPGSVVDAVLNGRLQRVAIVGTVLSPEYVFATRAGAPDDQWFGVMWVDAERLARVFDMDGAFNRAALELAPGVAPRPVLDALDRLLEPWGGVAAVARDRQLSSSFVDNELRQLEVLGTVLPAIFLGVGALVLGVVMSRQVTAQRQAIATLKAVGYADRAIAWHFVQFALVVAALGALIGLALSAFLGPATLSLYAEVFRFAHLAYRSDPGVIAAALLACAAASVAGTLVAIRAIAALTPAQALQPPVPPTPRRLWPAAWHRARGVNPARAMVLRHLAGRPLRSLLTATGIAAAVALQISGAFWHDTLDELVDLQYRHTQRGDVTLEFFSPRPPAVVDALRRLPGVLDAQAWRSEPARLIAGGRPVDVLVIGQPADGQLNRLIGPDRRAVQPSPDAVIVNALAARELGIGPGDTVSLVFRQWHRRQVEVRVEAVVRTPFGRVVMMDQATLRRLAGDGEGLSLAIVSLDPQQADAFFAALRRSPVVAAVGDRAAALDSFERTTARNLGFFTGVLTLFAVAMAAGITYNAVRIALAERAWELASLRVMGMTRAEVSALLLAEVGVLVLAAVPAGCVLGWALAHFLISRMASDSIDFPVVILPATYAWAVIAVLAAAAGSALAVRRRIDRLDLVAVLKVRP